MKFEKMPRVFRNYIPDLRDNLPSSRPPVTVHENIENLDEAAPLLETLVPPIARARILESAEKLPEGTSRARIVVGKQEDGTRHPHDFVVSKQGDVSELYFIDPEHQMGKSRKGNGMLPRKGDIRPKVATLMGMRLGADASIEALSILRFRTQNIRDQHVLKMTEQLKEARKLLHSNDLPAFLAGLEREITFHVQVRPGALLATSRYASKEQLEQFLNGTADTEMLKGKIGSYSLLMEHFARHLERDRFGPLTHTRE